VIAAMDNADLPQAIADASAWYGPDMAARQDWIWRLSPADLAEIAAATAPLVARETDIARITEADFPLPTLAPRLDALRRELLDGRGFALLKGLPVASLSRRAAATAFFGLGAHLGRARPQNAKGHVLGHVCDLGLAADDPNVRLYQTNERQTFHTDSCDIVGLLCLKAAKRGGHSALVSSTTLYNEMRRRRPDLARALLRPIETDRRGEVGAGQLPYFRIPVWTWHAGRLSAIYQRQYIESARRFPGVPPLTPTQVEALDLFDALANDPALNFHMVLEPGDLQFVHNHTILHDRTGFEDWPEPGRKRHLLRLWLAAPGARPLPPIWAERYGSVAIGDRGGVFVPGMKLNAPLDPA
jgi:hypothetical protein